MKSSLILISKVFDVKFLENVRKVIGRQVEVISLVLPFNKLSKVEPGIFVWVTDGEEDTLQEVLINDPFQQEFTCLNADKLKKICQYESVVEIHKDKSKTRKRKVSFIRIRNKKNL